MGEDRSTHTRLLKVLVIIPALATPIITHRIWNSSSLPAQFGVISSYGRQTIFQTGRLPSSVQGPTWVGALRDNSLHDSLNVIYSAEINLITGTTGIKEADRLHEIFPWHYLIFIPLAIYLFVQLRRKYHAQSDFTVPDMAILFAYVMFPYASRPLIAHRGLTARSAAALSLFHLILAIILLNVINDRKYGKRRNLAHVFLLVAFFPFHHTWSYYLLILLGSIGLWALIRGQNIAGRFVSYGIFIWITMSAFLFQNQILEPTRLIAAFTTNLSDINTLLKPSETSEIAPKYIHSAGPTYSTLQLINAVTIVSLFVIFGLLLLHRLYNRNSNETDEGFGAVFFGQSLIAAGLFVWAGVGGIASRIFQVSIPISRILLAYLLLTAPSKRLKNVVRSIAVIAVIICLVSITIYPPSLTYQISHQEAAGIETVGSNTPSEQAIFSDYRLSTPFMLYGTERIYTIDSRRTDPAQTESLLDAVYYGEKPPATGLDQTIPDDSYTVYLTQRQSEVGILDVTLTTFRPADQTVVNNWESSENFSKLYDNGDGVAYIRDDEDQ